MGVSSQTNKKPVQSPGFSPIVSKNSSPSTPAKETDTPLVFTTPQREYDDLDELELDDEPLIKPVVPPSINNTNNQKKINKRPIVDSDDEDLEKLLMGNKNDETVVRKPIVQENNEPMQMDKEVPVESTSSNSSAPSWNPAPVQNVNKKKKKVFLGD